MTTHRDVVEKLVNAIRDGSLSKRARVVFSPQGSLVGGMHLLLACVEANMAIKAFVRQAGLEVPTVH